jgi:5-formyltetrahydrofolate cyclo-ligase
MDRDKATLRAAVLAAREQLSGADLAGIAESLADHAEDAWGGATTVATYLSVGREPPTGTLIERLVAHRIVVLLPVVDGECLDWAPYDGRDAVARGPLGMVEPTTERLGSEAVQTADVVLVPALAVDGSGNRLGRGRGYYDRALTGVSAPVVAVVYENELIDTVPAEPHDRAVDGVVRPSGLVSFR